MNQASLRATIRRLRAIEAEMGKRTALSSPLSFCPHIPHPKQAEFLALDCREALYGGAAGGGKSDALLMAALQYVHVPSYAAILFRRRFTDLALPGALMDRAHAWFRGTSAKWSADTKTFRFPSGATITFAYLEHEDDRFRYQGAEFQFVGFDEGTQFSETQYRYLLSRLRRLAGSEVPIRARVASNPGGVGHRWVFDRFVKEGCARVFIPSTLDDNPSLDREEYTRTLEELDENTRNQLLKGLWVHDGKGLVYVMPRRIADLPPAPRWSRILAMDFGVVDETSFSVLAWRAHDPTLYVEESWKEKGLHPGAAADIALAIISDPQRPILTTIGDVGGLGKGFAAEMEARHNLPVEPAERTNKKGYIRLFNGAAEKGQIVIVEPKCADLISEYSVLSWHDEERTKESPSQPNHCADGVLYGWRHAWNFLERAEPPSPTEAQRIRADEEEMERQAEEETRSRRAHGRFGR